MPLHRESSAASLSPANHKSPPKILDPPSATEITTLTCSGCGKTGVSICARCSKKPGYKTMIARANPLQERDAELYKRLDEMSRLPLQENKQVWDEFCIEIKAGDFYEDLPILVEILHEGKWRTDALDPKKWLRENFTRRVRRSGRREDYGPTGRRRPGGPKFDKRSGALIAFSERPFTEFEVRNWDGDTISPDEEIEGRIARKNLQTVGGWDEYVPTFPRPADRESLLLLGRRTLAEQYEASRCAQMVDALKHDRPMFDKELATAITAQQALTERLGLDRDEAEVLAVKSLLWDAGPRMFLKFLDGANQKRIRNAWDRLDRRGKRPEFRRILQESAKGTQEERRLQYWADKCRSTDRQGWQRLISPISPITGRIRSVQPQIFYPPCTCGAVDHRFCACRCISGPIGGSWANPAGGSMRPDPGNFDGVVRLDCDLPPEEKRVYAAYEKKRNLRNTPIFEGTLVALESVTCIFFEREMRILPVDLCTL